MDANNLKSPLVQTMAWDHKPQAIARVTVDEYDDIFGDIRRQWFHTSKRNQFQFHQNHHSDVIMSAMASQITGVSIVCLTVCWGADQRKRQSSAPLPGSYEGNPITKGQWRGKFPIWWRHHVQCNKAKLMKIFNGWSSENRSGTSTSNARMAVVSGWSSGTRHVDNLCTSLTLHYNDKKASHLDKAVGWLSRVPCIEMVINANNLKSPLVQGNGLGATSHRLSHCWLVWLAPYEGSELIQAKGDKANLRGLIAATGLVILLKLDSNHRFFSPCDLEIWWMTPKNNLAPLLCYFKLFASFRNHWWIQTGVTVRKLQIWVKFDDFLAVWPSNLTDDLEKR